MINNDKKKEEQDPNGEEERYYDPAAAIRQHRKLKELAGLDGLYYQGELAKVRAKRGKK